MLAPWVSDEMKSADLNDKRLNARLTQVLSALGEHPTASIPAACGGWDEIVAAYRFFDNEKVTYERIMAPHGEGTLQRIAAQSIVLLVQDTTELDFTRPQQQMVGTGSLDGSSRCGAFLHPLVAFTRDGTPLGTCGTTIWVRDEESDETRVETPSERSKRLKATPIEEKESHRWIDGLRQARQVAQQVPEVKCICISDSESDIYELFLEPRGERPVCPEQGLGRHGGGDVRDPEAELGVSAGQGQHPKHAVGSVDQGEALFGLELQGLELRRLEHLRRGRPRALGIHYLSLAHEAEPDVSERGQVAGAAQGAVLVHDGGDPIVQQGGQGDLAVKLTVRAHKISAGARQKIEAAGGTFETIE